MELTEQDWIVWAMGPRELQLAKLMWFDSDIGCWVARRYMGDGSWENFYLHDSHIRAVVPNPTLTLEETLP